MVTVSTHTPYKPSPFVQKAIDGGADSNGLVKLLSSSLPGVDGSPVKERACFIQQTTERHSISRQTPPLKCSTRKFDYIFSCCCSFFPRYLHFHLYGSRPNALRPQLVTPFSLLNCRCLIISRCVLCCAIKQDMTKTSGDLLILLGQRRCQRLKGNKPQMYKGSLTVNLLTRVHLNLG